MLCFQSVHTGGGGGDLHPIILPLVACFFQGVPHLHPITLPLVRYPFQGRYPSDWSQVTRGGPHDEGTPQPGMGTPSGQVKMGGEGSTP